MVEGGGGGGEKGRGVLWTSSDRDDRKIFFEFEIFDSGMFLGSKIGQMCFWVFSVFNTL